MKKHILVPPQPIPLIRLSPGVFHVVIGVGELDEGGGKRQLPENEHQIHMEVESDQSLRADYVDVLVQRTVEIQKLRSSLVVTLARDIIIEKQKSNTTKSRPIRLR